MNISLSERIQEGSFQLPVDCKRVVFVQFLGIRYIYITIHFAEYIEAATEKLILSS